MTTTSLGGSASRGAAVTGVGQLIRILVQLVSLVVLARLLEPADFGLVAMVTAVVGVGEVFRDFGLSSAAIQARSISQQQRSNLFWINAGIGLLLTVAAVAIGPLVAELYEQPSVAAVMAACGTTFLLNGAATQHRADLNRSLRFGTLAAVDTVAQVMSVGLAILLALLGSGYWALVVMVTAQAALGLVGVLVVGSWLPSPYRRSASVASFFKFGAGIAGSQLLGYASKNVDSFVLGLTLGPTAVGYYNRAYQVLMLPLNQLQAPATRVALPVLSRLQDDGVRYEAYLLRGQTILLHAVASVLALAAGTAPAAFRLILGPQWDEAVPIFQALAVGGLATMAGYACYWVFLSQGLTASYFWFSLATRPLIIGAIVVGAITGGGVGVALAYSVVNLILWPVTYLWLKRVTILPIRRLFFNGVRTFVAYGIAGTAAWLATGLAFPGSVENISALFVGVPVFVAILVGVAVVSSSFRQDLLGIWETVKLLRRGA